MNSAWNPLVSRTLWNSASRSLSTLAAEFFLVVGLETWLNVLGATLAGLETPTVGSVKPAEELESNEVHFDRVLPMESVDVVQPEDAAPRRRRPIFELPREESVVVVNPDESVSVLNAEDQEKFPKSDPSFWLVSLRDL